MKYAVVTYIFGKGKEILREPDVIDNDIEYICVTDQKDLKSNTWRIVYDNIEQAKCVRDKMVYVKYNPFKYTEAEYVCVIDGTLKIKSSLANLFKSCIGHDMVIKMHPERTCIEQEIKAWQNWRGMPNISADKLKFVCKHDGVDIKKNFLIESCVIVYSKNSKKVRELCGTVVKYMNFLGEDVNLFLSNQLITTFLLIKAGGSIKLGILNQKDYFLRYNHGTNQLHDR